jgi:ribosomal protein S18 acetylase RimI-like enzyme
MRAVKVREAEDADVPGIAVIHVRSWQTAYRGVLPDELLDGLSVSEREGSWRALLGESEERWLTLVAERSGSDLAGFCSVATPSRDEDVDALTAELGALYVDPDHWRQGAGRAMLAAALEELDRRRFHDVILWVLPENHAALAFYDRFGFEVEEGVEKREEHSGRPVIRLRASLPPASSS